MKKILIASHGTLAEGFKHTLEILGIENDNINFMNFYCGKIWTDADVCKYFENLLEDEQLFVFTDIQFGSINQLFMKTAAKYPNKNVIILTGINLPLLLEVVTTSGILSKEQVKTIIEKATLQMTMVEVSELVSHINDEDIF